MIKVERIKLTDESTCDAQGFLWYEKIAEWCNHRCVVPIQFNIVSTSIQYVDEVPLGSSAVVDIMYKVRVEG